MSGPIIALAAVAAYAALHSLLATRWAKERARELFGKWGDRYYRLVYNFVGTATLLPVLAIPALFPGRTLYRIPWPWAGLAVGLQILAALIVALGLLQTDVWHFLGFRQLLDGERVQSRLIVSGLYRWVRHPLYSAGIAFLWLTPLMTTTLLALYLAFSVYFYVGSVFEERRLVAAFGEAYADYQRSVPRLVPRPWQRYPARPQEQT